MLIKAKLKFLVTDPRATSIANTYTYVYAHVSKAIEFIYHEFASITTTARVACSEWCEELVAIDLCSDLMTLTLITETAPLSTNIQDNMVMCYW